MSPRMLNFLGFLIVCGLLLVSLYLQYFQHFQPCPLCTLQRICFALAGVFFLIGAFIYRFRILSIINQLLVLFFTVAGFSFAARQTWIQLYPPADSGECGVSIEYMAKVLPWHEVMAKVLAGTAECTQRTWEFLTLSMPEWAMIWFALLFIISSILLMRKWPRRR